MIQKRPIKLFPKAFVLWKVSLGDKSNLNLRNRSCLMLQEKLFLENAPIKKWAKTELNGGFNALLLSQKTNRLRKVYVQHTKTF
jgi:hypothetical protein